MYQNVLRGIENVAVWPVISFVIFFTFFVGLVWWAFTADKNYISNMSEMPLKDSNTKDLKIK